MPRSDKLYVFITVGLACVLVIASIIATIKILSGQKQERPAYESAPAKALTKANPTSGSIIDVDNAERPPIDDNTYLLLHRETRLITRDLATGKGWRERVWQDGISADGLSSLASQRAKLKADLNGGKVRRNVSVTVYRPTPPSDTKIKAQLVSKTAGSVGVASSSGSKIGVLRTEIFWQRRGNLWQIQDVVLQMDVSDVAGSSPTNPSEEGTVDSPSSSTEPTSPDASGGSINTPDTPTSESEAP